MLDGAQHKPSTSHNFCALRLESVQGAWLRHVGPAGDYSLRPTLELLAVPGDQWDADLRGEGDIDSVGAAQLEIDRYLG